MLNSEEKRRLAHKQQIASQQTQHIQSVQPKRKSRRFFTSSVIFALLIIFATWWLLSVVSSRLAWKVIFLDSNQVYFGRFIDIPFVSSITLHDVHYVETSVRTPEIGQTIDVKPDITVLPISNSPHSPKDSMVVRKDHIRYYQSLRPDSVLYKGLNERR